ncbi:serine/threonine protein kinase [Aetokthonos hydrillicola Thurmond2011]|jgi:WD40 repeat protein|uniref:Serine/threonine protein kinase n=1 Tax=Aetokthonos hydrillicola Thurmond2011 TaxID=2712845 RepID=A0AAP5M7E5_9CYAN|nr:serine/threonine-protein kinase [Aetokthonos hydrillicola]MBO3462317.1 protein kinase [Aetokthonos hydrillicola CCALA 1050]MBW4590828.1 serine/threonine protein kinase [Aetokthonos hydrillicola CCALA 1050]MDR9893627.1 serine/threonine protein kinase [Aetokthonos hydrillicola Thurmond2011]
MICCLNPACHNPPCADDTKFCSNCGTGLVVLRNRYRPVKSLGGGGFGKTYLAEDIDKLNEKCVIKQFAPQVQGTGALQKATELFEQEAIRLQHLGEHPQIPTLLAYFQQDNRLYLVQQYIEGENLLAELEQQGVFSEQKIRELLLDLLNILKEVHAQQVIHRDIKPDNLIRRPDGRLVLIDFGASKRLTTTVINYSGTAIGSFGYASVEQMHGGKAYPASDLFSLGTTCFHLLTGVHPWELWKSQGYSWVAHWRDHLQQPVSQELGHILDKLLQGDYHQRYQSATEVLQELNQPPPSQAKTQPQPVVLQRNNKLKKSLLLSGAIALLALVGTQIYSYIRDHSVRDRLLPTNSTVKVPSLSSNNFLQQRTLLGHSGWVTSIAISPDSKILASGSWDNTIKLWNLATGEQIRTLQGHSDPVISIAISPDGDTLASGSRDNTIKLWNLATGEQIRTLEGHSDLIRSVAISPDSRTLASGSLDNIIKLWNLATGEQTRTLQEHSDGVNSFLALVNTAYSIAFSPDSKILASGSYDSTIKLWNLGTGEQIRTLQGHSKSVYSVAISPDGKILASGSADNTIKLWNLATGGQIRTLQGHSSEVNSVAFSPDGKTLASGSDDNTVKLWNLATGEPIRTLQGHSGSVRSVAFSPDGKILASGSEDKTIKIWAIP